MNNPQNHDPISLKDALRQAAPRPRADLKADIAARLTADTSNIGPTRRIPARALLVLAAVLTIGVGVALAVSGALQQMLAADDGLLAVYRSGAGREIGLSETIDGYTVTLDWAHADSHRLTIAYIIEAPPADSQYTNLTAWPATLRDRHGAELELHGGMTAALTESGEFIESADAEYRRTLSLFSYDLAGVSSADSLDLRLELGISSVTSARRTAIPEGPFSAWSEGPSRHFIFDFTIALNPEPQRVLNTAQDATDAGITLTLRRVTVSPSQMRVTLCYIPPAADRTWMALPQLTLEGNPVTGGGAMRKVSGIGEAAGETCDEFLYSADLYDATGLWTLTLTELVGMGSSGADQQRIAGTWAINFTVP